jgi:hypothetical protein
MATSRVCLLDDYIEQSLLEDFVSDKSSFSTKVSLVGPTI